MKSNRYGKHVALSILGGIVFFVGLALAKLFPEAEGILKTWPYVCTGLGAGMFGGNLATTLRYRTAMKNPQFEKQAAIDEKDERNRAIRDKAKSRVYDLMVYVYAAILLAFALLQVDIYVVLTLVAVYLFFIFSNVYYLSKYNKEM